MRLFLSFDLNTGFAAIIATVGANMMRDMVFAAVFAAQQVIERQRIVRTTPVTAAAGVFSLR